MTWHLIAFFIYVRIKWWFIIDIWFIYFNFLFILAVDNSAALLEGLGLICTALLCLVCVPPAGSFAEQNKTNLDITLSLSQFLKYKGLRKVLISSKLLFSYLILYIVQWTSAKKLIG